MNTFIILLRGINVSGQKKVPMAELRGLLEKNGFQDVKTYIQSGNVVLRSLFDAEVTALKIQQAIENYFGFQVSVLAKSPQEFQQIFDDCPFDQNKKEKSYFTLLFNVPNKELVNTVSKISYPNEEFIIDEACIYFYCSTGYGRAKCSNNFFEKKLKTTATSRNYKTMMKLLSLCSEY